MRGTANLLATESSVAILGITRSWLLLCFSHRIIDSSNLFPRVISVITLFFFIIWFTVTIIQNANPLFSLPSLGERWGARSFSQATKDFIDVSEISELFSLPTTFFVKGANEISLLKMLEESLLFDRVVKKSSRLMNPFLWMDIRDFQRYLRLCCNDLVPSIWSFQVLTYNLLRGGISCWYFPISLRRAIWFLWQLLDSFFSTRIWFLLSSFIEQGLSILAACDCCRLCHSRWWIRSWILATAIGEPPKVSRYFCISAWFFGSRLSMITAVNSQNQSDSR